MVKFKCPDCGSFISDQALSCPVCGYVGKNPKRPLSTQGKYYVKPIFQYQLEEWSSDEQKYVMSFPDNDILINEFGNYNQLKKNFPQIAQVIEEGFKV